MTTLQGGTTTVSKERTATTPTSHTGTVVLINSFVVNADAASDARFRELWEATSTFFRSQQGFRSLRLHRAVSPGARYRYVNVVEWESAEAYRMSHEQDAFIQLVSAEGWKEFPSTPALYELVEHVQWC